MKTALRFRWDEPAGCTTPRGWCMIYEQDHPDRKLHNFDYARDACGALCCGNYLEYKTTRGPNGETIHAVAYFHHVTPNVAYSVVRLGYAWFHTIAEAKDFIEGNVSAYLGLARPERFCAKQTAT